MCYGNYGKYQKPTSPHVVFSTGQWTSCQDEITFDNFKMAESTTRVVNGKNTIHDLENILAYYLPFEF